MNLTLECHTGAFLQDPETVCVSVCFQETEVDREQMRKEMEQQLEAWHKLSPGSQEEVRHVPDSFHGSLKTPPSCMFFLLLSMCFRRRRRRPCGTGINI